MARERVLPGSWYMRSKQIDGGDKRCQDIMALFWDNMLGVDVDVSFHHFHIIYIYIMTDIHP